MKEKRNKKEDVNLLVNIYLLILTCVLLGVTAVMAFCGSQRIVAPIPIEPKDGSLVFHICGHPGLFGSAIGPLLFCAR